MVWQLSLMQCKDGAQSLACLRPPKHHVTILISFPQQCISTYIQLEA